MELFTYDHLQVRDRKLESTTITWYVVLQDDTTADIVSTVREGTQVRELIVHFHFEVLLVDLKISVLYGIVTETSIAQIFTVGTL